MHRLIVVAATALLALTSPARAQRPIPADIAPADDVAARALARVFVGEAGWEAEGEHAALAWTLTRRAIRLHRTRGWSWQRTARAYATANLVRPRQRRQRWIVALELGGGMPRTWRSSTRASWSVHADAWKRALERARAFVRGELQDPCNGPSEHWSTRAFAAERVRSGELRNVDCGRTRNGFFALGVEAVRAPRYNVQRLSTQARQTHPRLADAS